MKPSPTLERVERGSLCAGCGLCAGISNEALAMRMAPPGYARPRQRAPLAADAEAVFADVCPGLVVEPWRAPEGGHIDHHWGPIATCATGHAADPAVRHTGSSGGAISALAIHALRTELARQVLHVDADPDRPTGNRSVLSTTPEEVLSRAGSRYAPSSPLQGIERVLASGVPTVFIGKPCDVSALRRLARHDVRVDEVFVLKLSFFCGGIPSSGGADRIVSAMGLAPDRLARFRYRGDGWPGLTVAEEAGGARGEMTYEESWGRYLSSQVQFRCKICPDPVGGVADIACADAWYGGESGYPQFDEADGRSLILARTEFGRTVLDAATAAGAVAIEPLDPAEIHLMQPAQARRKRRITARMAAWRLAGRPVPRISGLGAAEARREERWILLAKEFLGTTKRIVQGRI